jgi:hypothetical protein
MAEIDSVLARVTELERAMIGITESHKSGKSLLSIALSVFVAVSASLVGLSIYSINRIDVVSDRVSDTRDETTKIGAGLTVLAGRFDGLEKQVDQVDVRVQSLGDKVDYLTSTTLLVARAVGIPQTDLPLARDPEKPQ